MIHEDAGLAAFLNGEIDDAEAAAWDEHLLSCDDCWTALDEAHRGRALAESMREAAPAGLRERVTMAVAASVDARRPRPERRRVSRMAATAAAAVAIALAVAGVVVRQDRGTHDPQPIAAVLRLAADRRARPPATGDGVQITRLTVNGRDVVLARGERDFPMPEGGIALSDDPHSPWLAQRGEISLLCFSYPKAILLAGRASPATLTEVAVALGISFPGRNQTTVRGVPSV